MFKIWKKLLDLLSHLWVIKVWKLDICDNRNYDIFAIRTWQAGKCPTPTVVVGTAVLLLEPLRRRLPLVVVAVGGKLRGLVGVATIANYSPTRCRRAHWRGCGQPVIAISQTWCLQVRTLLQAPHFSLPNADCILRCPINIWGPWTIRVTARIKYSSGLNYGPDIFSGT